MSAATTTSTVSDAYVAAHAEALDLIASFQEIIENMPEPESDSINWGHVGSLNQLNSQLRELLLFVNK